MITLLLGPQTATPANTESLGDDTEVQKWLGSTNPCTSWDDTSQASFPVSTPSESFATIGSLAVTRMASPCVGDTLLIIDKSQNCALACRNGILRLEKVQSIKFGDPVLRCWQWEYTENDVRFTGFKSVAEGSWLGRNIWWNYYAKVYHYKAWESFTVSRRESGYYWIQMLDNWTHYQISVRDGQILYAERWEGTLWEFVKIHS